MGNRGGNPKQQFMRHVERVIGQRFGRLVALAPCGRQRNEIVWACRCDCGNITLVVFGNLGRTTNSCGCLARELSSDRESTHRMTKTREYNTWQAMINRCTNPKADQWEFYGGRGLSVCPQWLNSFEQFFADMGPRPVGYTLDRIRVNGNYEASNCKWSHLSEQRRNQRRPSLVGFSKFKGVHWNGRRWVAQVSIKNKAKYLGSFHTERDAALCYDKNALLVYGEGAITNASLGRL